MTVPFRRLLGAALLCALSLWGSASWAALDEATRQKEADEAWKAAATAATRGPASVKLRDQATLNLPQNMAFIPAPEGTRLMRALGNVVDGKSFVGLVVPMGNGGWITVIKYHGDGYVRDDDAKDWNPDDLLQSLKDGTAEANKDRAQRGFPELEVAGWVQQPSYDSASHRLVWSVLAREKGQAEASGVNYNTNALGRNGHFSLNLLTSKDQVAGDKQAALAILQGLTFNSGARYEDFNASTDHVAEYGLAALLGVVAAKKLGLLAGLGLLIAKFAKVFLLAAAGFGAAIMRFLRGKKAKPVPAIKPQEPAHPAENESGAGGE
jgi:uncharacterized membrane-anchored protein